ncbi:MAG: putative DNA binding domain-containing protein [Acidobacteria bacterium]|nr:putative DNA binding domain-containing protein [Acidobacteriota bacterium]
MPQLNIQRTRDLLQKFDFRSLFIEELGWSHSSSRKPVPWQKNDWQGSHVMIAQLAGVAVFEVTTAAGKIPDVQTCRALANEISKQHYENLLIFTDAQRTQSLWYYVKREDGKAYPREHWYFKGQPGDLFLSKLSGMVVDLGEFDAEGNIEVTKVARKLKDALDVERVTKQFFGEFYDEHIHFVEMIEGVADERDRHWYGSVLLYRLMFIYFLQAKHFINNGETKYLQNRLQESQKRSTNRYYAGFLKALFFEGFAKPENERSPEARALLGQIKYLNGGLFIEHRIETDNPGIQIPDVAFENLFGLFDRYSWNLDDTPGGKDDEISPDVLGYIFEKYINQKAFGAYYTRPEITEYLCEQTVYQLILGRLADGSLPGPERRFETMGDVLLHLDADLCRKLQQILRELSILDPACGSGAFLVAAMKTLINLYAAVIGKIKVLNDTNLTHWLKGIERDHPNVSYFIKKTIITDNIFGVDVMEEATEIAKLRLFLALVASAESGKVEQLEPLPNIDFNILAGNSLIGLMRVDDAEYDRRSAQGNLFIKPYRRLLEEKNRLIDNYRHATAYGEDLRRMRDEIAMLKEESARTLNDLLHEEFKQLKIQFEQATWDERKNAEGNPQKRPVKLADIEALHPYHWGYEFDEVINKRGGFDVIITNPPWEIFKPQAKEFFAEHSNLVTKNKMTIKEFDKEQAKLLKNSEIRRAWLEYQSRFPHISAYFRNSTLFKNQISIVYGKRAGTDINLYKLFLEQCFNLLRNGGRCGILVPTGIYTDLGTKQLRETLFSECTVDSLMAFSNEKFIFEGVHHSFKFCLLAFEKGGETDTFNAAFRFNPREAIRPEDLTNFLNNKAEHVTISVPLIRKLSPDSISVTEFRNEMDVRIAEKMQRYPLLGERLNGKWNYVLTNEFHITNDSHLFKTSPGKGRLPLFTGKMFHQFCLTDEHSGYWIDEKNGRKALLGKNEDKGQLLDYQGYRWVHRRIARNTDSRTLISTITPRNVFTEVNSTTIKVLGTGITSGQMLFLCAITNSLTLDWLIRQKITTTLNMFYLYQLPVPRLTKQDKEFAPIVGRAAKLICTTPEFDDLAKEVGLGSHRSGETDEAERAQLRAELDGMVAHLYGLTEEEFAYILTTFPLVSQEAKDAALAAYRALAPHPDDRILAELIVVGESARLEFKVAARWNPHKQARDDSMKENIVQGVAAYLNSREGGALLIGVGNDGTVIGIEEDFLAVNPQKPGRDSYELFLRNLLGDALGGEHSHSYQISFHQVNGRELCRIAVDPAPRPVYVKGEMYVRSGNQKRKLNAKEAVEYQKQRWP